MTDEIISVGVTDNGTIDAIAEQLELLGFTAEQAMARLSSAFVSSSTAQYRVEAAQNLVNAAVGSGIGPVIEYAGLVERLTAADIAKATSAENLARFQALLVVQQLEGIDVARQVMSQSTAEIAARYDSIAAMHAQAEASGEVVEAQEGEIAVGQELTRLQINLAASVAEYNARQEASVAATRAASAAYEAQQASLNAAANATGNLSKESETLSIAVKGLYGTYTGLDTLFGAQAAEARGAAEELAVLSAGVERTTGTFAAFDRELQESAADAAFAAAQFTNLADAGLARLASNERLTASTAATAAAQETADAAIKEFIALQGEANTSTIVGRAATEAAATAYRTAVGAIGAYNVEQELLLANVDRNSTAALKMANSLNLAAIAADKLAAAEEVAATAAVSLEARMLAVGKAGGKLGETFGGLNAIFAGAFAVGEIVKFSDAYTKVIAGLSLVTTSSAQLTAVYNQLHVVSNETQTSLEGNAKLFVNLAEITKGTGASANDLIQSVKGVDVALKLGNVTGQDAYRVLRSISEIFSSADSGAGRFFQNLRRESPPTFAAFQQSAERLGLSLDDFGAKTDGAAKKNAQLEAQLTKVNAKLDGSGLTLSQASRGVSFYGEQHTTAAKEVDKLSASIASGTVQTAAQSAEYIKAQSTLQTSTTYYNAYSGAVMRLKGAEQQRLAGQAQTINQQIAANAATSQGSAKALELVAITRDIAYHDGELAKSFTTVAGTLTVLSNNMLDFAGNSSTTNIVTGLLKDTILLLAGNLDIVVPAVLLFAGAVALVKIATLVGEVRDLYVAFTTLNFALLPEIALFAAVALGVIGIAYATSKLIEALTFGNVKILDFNAALEGLSSIGDLAGKAMNGLTAKIREHAIQAQEGKDAEAALAQQVKGTGTAAETAGAQVDAYGKTVGGVVAKDGAASGANAGLASSFNGVANAANGAAQAVGKFSNAQRASSNVGGSTQSTQSLRGSNVISSQDLSGATSGYSSSNGGVSQNYSSVGQATSGTISGSSGSDSVGYTPTIIGGQSDIGKGDDPATYTSPTSIGDNSSYLPSDSTQFRDGGTTFHVAGGTGVDTKTIKVSPGEVVTVQTPTQFRQNVVSLATGKAHFADGGVTFGAGVTLGTGVSSSTTASTPDGSVTGFTDSRSDAVGILTTAVAAQTDATDANTTATVANTDALDGTTSSSSSAANDNTASSAAPSSVVEGTSATVQTVSDAQKAYNTANTSPGAVTQGGPGRFPILQPNYVFDANGVYQGTQSRDMFGNLVTSGGVSVGGAARDGGDFFVPGGTGVDTQHIAVSPGEHVSVRTPGQQRAAPAQSSSVNVIMNVTAADASSFKQSQPQLASKVVQGLRRQARRG